jgi:tartrate dehydratase beta subunit/fumarate hydratase class I family protein
MRHKKYSKNIQEQKSVIALQGRGERGNAQTRASSEDQTRYAYLALVDFSFRWDFTMLQ